MTVKKTRGCRTKQFSARFARSRPKICAPTLKIVALPLFTLCMMQWRRAHGARGRHQIFSKDEKLFVYKNSSHT